MNFTGVRTMMARLLMVAVVAGAFGMLAPTQANAEQGFAGSRYGHDGWRGGDRARGHFDDRAGGGFADRRRDDGFHDRERFAPQHGGWDRGRDGDRFHGGRDRGYGYR